MADRYSFTRDTLQGGSVVRQIAIVTVVVIALLAITISVTGNEPIAETSPDQDGEVVNQDPTGAGTNADGPVDQQEEGLGGDSQADELLENTTAPTEPGNIGEGGNDAAVAEEEPSEVEPAAGDSENPDAMVEESQSGTDDGGVTSEGDDGATSDDGQSN